MSYIDIYFIIKQKHRHFTTYFIEKHCIWIILVFSVYHGCERRWWWIKIVYNLKQCLIEFHLRSCPMMKWEVSKTRSVLLCIPTGVTRGVVTADSYILVRAPKCVIPCSGLITNTIYCSLTMLRASNVYRVTNANLWRYKWPHKMLKQLYTSQNTRPSFECTI